MRVAILTPTFNTYSGIDRVVELQAEEYINKGDNVSIFALEAEMEPKRAQLVVIGIPKNLLMQRITRLFYFINRSDIKKYGEMLGAYDLVISHFYPMNYFALYAKKHYGVKYIYHNHGVAGPRYFNSFVEKVYVRILQFLVKQTTKDADEIVSISKYMQSEFKKETGRDSIVVYDKINTGNLDKYSQSAIPQIQGSPLCLFVGRISPHKGLHFLIPAFNLVLKKKPHAKLIIIGKPTFDEYYNKLVSLINDPNAIIFKGVVSDEELPAYYKMCDIYVTASLWEGFNMPIVEAQYLGKPVVAFDIGPHSEVIDSKGKLVPEGDIQAFADAILETKI